MGLAKAKMIITIQVRKCIMFLVQCLSSDSPYPSYFSNAG